MMEIKYFPNMQCEENWAIWTVLLFRSSLRYRKETSLFRKDINIKLDSSFRFPVLWLEKGHKPLLTLDYLSDKIISGLWEYFTGSHLQYCFPFAALPSGKKRSSLTRRLSPFWNSERPEKERHSFSTNQVNLEFAWINKSCNGPNTVKAINDPGVKIVICALRSINVSEQYLRLYAEAPRLSSSFRLSCRLFLLDAFSPSKASLPN